MIAVERLLIDHRFLNNLQWSSYSKAKTSNLLLCNERGLEVLHLLILPPLQELHLGQQGGPFLLQPFLQGRVQREGSPGLRVALSLERQPCLSGTTTEGQTLVRWPHTHSGNLSLSHKRIVKHNTNVNHRVQ